MSPKNKISKNKMIEILKMPMGKTEKDGKYTPDSILRRIEDRLEKKKEVEKDS